MDSTDDVEFANLMMVLTAAFDVPMSPQRTEIFFRALTRFSLEQVKVAVNQAIETLKFLPKVAELIQIIEGEPGERAERAWQVLMNAYRQAGYWDSVIFEDAGISAAVVSMWGSWVR